MQRGLNEALEVVMCLSTCRLREPHVVVTHYLRHHRGQTAEALKLPPGNGAKIILTGREIGVIHLLAQVLVKLVNGRINFARRILDGTMFCLK